MNRLVLLLGALALAGCASEGPPQTFDNNDLELVVGNATRMTCSCLFVMNMSEEYCRAWTKARPDIARFSVDWQNKRIEASTFIVWPATAHFVDDKVGCVLE